MINQKQRMDRMSDLQREFCAALERDDRRAMLRIERQFDALARLAQREAAELEK